MEYMYYKPKKEEIDEIWRSIKSVEQVNDNIEILNNFIEEKIKNKIFVCDIEECEKYLFKAKLGIEKIENKIINCDNKEYKNILDKFNKIYNKFNHFMTKFHNQDV